MTNVLQAGAQWLGDSLKVCAGRTVTITDGINTVADVTGSVSLSEYETLDDDGFPLVVRSFDWVFETADIEGVAMRAGTLITEGATVYEVNPLANRPAVENNDTSGILLLVHSKLIVSVDPEDQ